MPPIRLKLRDLPRAPDGAAGDDNNQKQAAPPQRSSAGMAVGAGIAARTAEHLSDAWRAWPVAVIAHAQSAIKGWFARMDAALLVLPKGIGPAMSTLVRPGGSVCVYPRRGRRAACLPFYNVLGGGFEVWSCRRPEGRRCSHRQQRRLHIRWSLRNAVQFVSLCASRMRELKLHDQKKGNEKPTVPPPSHTKQQWPRGGRGRSMRFHSLDRVPLFSRGSVMHISERGIGFDGQRVEICLETYPPEVGK